MKEVERQKKLTLEGRVVSDIPEAPNWNDRLASDSEAIVKAERCQVKDINELQEITIKTIERREKEERVDDEEIMTPPTSEQAPNNGIAGA